MRGGRSTLALAIAAALAAAASCGDSGKVATPSTEPSGQPGAPCAPSGYPVGPYGTKAGDVLADVSFQAIDEAGQSSTFSMHSAFSSCSSDARVLVLRVTAGFCGTCRWHAAHVSSLLGPTLLPRIRLVDVLVRNDDGEEPAFADLADWRARQDAPATIALDPKLQLVLPRASLPRILVVDPRTMKVAAALDDPAPETLHDAVASAVADLDGQAAPPGTPVARIDGRFTSEQWDLFTAMRQFGGRAPPDRTNRLGDDIVVAALGQRLFDDKTLSPSGLVSCERCHEKARAFTDGSETAPGGVGGADRNTPSIVLASWSRWQLWDGRADSLWMQALLPIEDAREFGSSRLFVAHRIFDAYRTEYEALFGPLPPFGDTVRFPESGKPGDPAWEHMTASDREAVTHVFVDVGKTIAVFERSFRVTEQPFEAYLRGDKKALTELQKDGLAAFFSSGCAQCHWGNRLTDDAFHVLRFPTGRNDLEPDHGRADGIAKLLASEFRGDGRWSDEVTVRRAPSPARMLGAFKTPMLRGVGVTGPYGHGGSVPTLRSAVDLHRTAGMPAGNRYTTGDAEPWLVDFPADRVEAITAFLQTMGLASSR